MVSFDLPSEVEERLIPTLKKFNLTAEVIILDDPDFNSWINKVSKTWSGAIPATMIYKSDERDYTKAVGCSIKFRK